MPFPDLAKRKEMMSQAREMQAQMEQKLAATIVEAESGGGMVSVRMNGKKEVLRIKIEPTALGASTGDGSRSASKKLSRISESSTGSVSPSSQWLIGFWQIPRSQAASCWIVSSPPRAAARATARKTS